MKDLNYKDFLQARQKIEKINDQIEKLLEKRFVQSNIIGMYKLQNNLPIEDKARENRLKASVAHDVYYNYIREIQNKIFQQSKLQQSRLKMPSIILIGMPGCGKTAFGKQISKEMKLPFVDIDEAIVAREGMWENEIFEKYGEKYFRNKEKKVVNNLTKGFIIASGGGTVLDPENLEKLKEIGKIIYLKRDIDSLLTVDMKNRPLVNSSEDLVKLYNERNEIYENIADYVVENNMPFNKVKYEIKGIIFSNMK